MHPMLAGSGADQLRIIAATPGWRAMHLSMLAGSALVIAGLWVRLAGAANAEVGALVAALGTIAIGLAVNALNIAFMAGAGWHMAAWFAAGRSEMASIFDAAHPIGLVAARFGNTLVALGATVLGWAEWRDARRPRWVALLAWLAAAGGFVGVLCVDESSRATLAAVALLSGWQIAAAVLALRTRSSPPADTP